MTDRELLTCVEDAIHTVLGVSRQDILPNAKLIGDLNAESIDFLDMSFELEKIVLSEVDFRELVKERNKKTPDAVSDFTVQEVADYLKFVADGRNAERSNGSGETGSR
jgi:acyl carrier protein